MSFSRTLRAGQRCRILVADIDGDTPFLVHESTERLYEAPNWAPNGDLLLNADGELWQVAATGGIPERVALDGVPELNNDHVLAPGGAAVYVSANDWHIYLAPSTGGRARRVTPDDGIMHFLHGVSPDGQTLAYTGLRMSDGVIRSATIFTMGADGTGVAQITRKGPDDGSEYAPDGAWIYFNTEDFEGEPGHAQIARMRPDGAGVEQLTFDERVNWFPHVSPDGRYGYYLSYPSGTVGHPADLDVELRLVRDGDWHAPHTIAALFGGQGTANVNGWAPDSRRLAYVDYPIGAEPA
jgi:Tol biopolymer transport system component